MRDQFLRGFIFADTNFAIFCILRRFISKDEYNLIVVEKRHIYVNYRKN